MVNNVVKDWKNRGVIYVKDGSQLLVEHNIFHKDDNKKVGKSENGRWQSFHNHAHRGQEIDFRDTARVDENFMDEAIHAYGRDRLVNCENSPPDYDCWEDLYDDVKENAGANLHNARPDINTTTGDSDSVIGSPAGDVINGQDGDDQISGMDGNDTINGNKGSDFINGNIGDDTVRGGRGDDTVRGGQGNDILFADRGTDHLYGDRGDDIYIFGQHAEHVFIHPDGDGRDTLRCEGVRVLLEARLGDDLKLWMSNGGTIHVLGIFVTSTIDEFTGCGQRFGTNQNPLTNNGDDQTNVLVGTMGSDAINGL